MSEEDWCRECLAKLQIKDKRLDTLTEIRNHLSSLPASEVAMTSNFLTLPELFDCVEDDGSSSSKQTNVACDILSICMSNLSIDHKINSYYLERSLQHANGDVKLLGLAEIERLLANAVEAPVSLEPSITIALIKCLEHGNVNVAAASIRILTQILPKSLATDQSVRANLTYGLVGSDLTRCRIYEVAIQVCRVSPDCLTQVEFITERLFADLDTDDVLLQLNVLGFLSSLALTNHGLIYLENKGIFARIAKNVQVLEDNPLKNLLIPGYMKFFGNIASTQPAKVIQGFPHMINSLFDCILDTDSVMLPVAFDTLGQLAQSSEGKILLHETYPAKLHETLTEIGKSIHNLTTKLQTRALNCLEVLFTIDQNQPNNRASSIARTWFGWLTGTTGLSFLLDFCRNPFPEIKIAAIVLLRAICGNRWGQQALAETAGFIEFLLDRRVEFDKDAIQEKYLMVRLLSESTVFDAATIVNLKRYVSEGAFYVTGILEVAVEGQDSQM